VSFTAAEGRRQLLDALAEAADALGVALTALGAAYEQLSERSADELEERLFGPVQGAYGRAQRAHAEFAARHGLSGRTFATPAPGHPSTGAKGFVEEAVDAVAQADETLATLQDSMLPVEVGDVELRAALAEVREQLAPVPGRARELVRTLGR
jgi:hypothetical protein